MYDIHEDHLRINPYYKCGEGKITIDHRGISYSGVQEKQEVNLFFDIKKIPCFKQINHNLNMFYYHGKFYGFMAKNINKSIKYMMIVEELHNLVDPNWAKAYDDAYN